MKDFIKYAAVGLVGYFIGFYEMKYKTIKVLLEKQMELEKKQEEESE